jgi:glycosyltransferase involved in cell wall biosynthesis
MPAHTNLTVCPRVTIGMPVYNGDEKLRHVLGSIVGQTYKDFRLVISDNASTDATETICSELAKRDQRVIYIRQLHNIGAEANFDFVLSKADTEYFMWAAADDVRSEDFIEKNLEFLDRNLDFVGSTCPVRFFGKGFDPVRMGDQSREEIEPFERMLKFFDIWHANGRFYSLFRTDALRAVKGYGASYLGSDWSTIVRLLAKGKFKRLDSGFVELGTNGISNSLDIFARYRNRLICWFFPMFDFSFVIVALFKRAPLKCKIKISMILLKANLMTFNWQIRFEIKRNLRRFTARTISLTSAHRST